MNVVLSKTLNLSNIPSDLHVELIQKLQFPNPKWIENHRLGRWNRGVPKTLKFFRRLKGGGLIIPRGFMRQLVLLGRKHHTEFEIDDKRRLLAEIPFTFHGTLKPYQTEAVDIMSAKDFGTLSAPTGSGKTVMALALVALRRQPTIIIVHTKDLAYQWIDRIGTFLNIPNQEVGFIGDGKNKVGDRVTIALVQSLYSRVRDVYRKIGYLIVDECHRAPSRIFTEAVKAFDSKYMLGLSATPYRRDGLSKLIFWHLGDVHHEIGTKNLVATGDILDVEVIFRPTVFKPYYDPVNEYSKMLTELVSDDKRNRLIAADIAQEVQKSDRPGVSLVLSDRKQHCLTLQLLLKHKYHIDAEILTGDLSMEQRKAVIEKTVDRSTRIIIATGQLVGEGLDCAALSTLFLATPVRFGGRLLQYLGRVLRPADGVERARVYDYVDEHVGPLLAAANARERVYRIRRK